MKVLGIYDWHNAGAALIEDGRITAAIEEERLSRNKIEFGFPVRSIRKIMQPFQNRNFTPKMVSFEQWNEDMVKKHHKKETLFESRNPLLRWAERERLKSMIRIARLRKEDAILDLGCGEGFLLKMMPRTRIIVGADLSDTALERAKKVL